MSDEDEVIPLTTNVTTREELIKNIQKAQDEDLDPKCAYIFLMIVLFVICPIFLAALTGMATLKITYDPGFSFNVTVISFLAYLLMCVVLVKCVIPSQQLKFKKKKV